jgi:CubicO group peptidase (beta-lactamase class C family)
LQRYILLGYIIEQVSSQSYATFLQLNIFEPLRMQNTGYDCKDASLAVGYQSFGIRAPLINWPRAYSVCTTVEDLYRWDQSLYTDHLLSKELLDAMFTPHMPAPALDPQFGEGSYGYGWFMGERWNRHVIGHGGWIPGSGFRTFIERYPNDKVTIIVLSNLEYAPIVAIASKIEQVVFEK